MSKPLVTQIIKTSSCFHCGTRVHLIKTGLETYKWVTNPKRPSSARCRLGTEHATNFPLWVHDGSKETNDGA
jgi:hypothetical protein